MIVIPKKTRIGTPVRGQGRREGEPKRQFGQGSQDLDQALDDVIDPTAEIARQSAEEQSERERDRNSHNADGERNPRSVDDAREEIAAQPVGAEEEHRAVLGRAEQMHVSWHQSPEVVTIATAQEPHRLRRRRIGGVDATEALDVEGELVRIDEGTHQPALVHQVHGLRRCVQEVTVALGIIVGRDHLHERNHGVEGEQDEGRGDRHLVAAELPPHQPPRRGAVETLALCPHGLGRAGIEGRLNRRSAS